MKVLFLYRMTGGVWLGPGVEQRTYECSSAPLLKSMSRLKLLGLEWSGAAQLERQERRDK